MKQTTDTLLMVRPAAFRMNEETAVNNYFQKENECTGENVNTKAQEEFDAFTTKLREAGIKVVVVQDEAKNDTPDSIFPNNWVSFHSDGRVALYPMFAENRRRERDENVFLKLEDAGYKIEEFIDYTSAEEENVFLEGTGSLVLDRTNRKAYCALSPRADEALVIEFCEDFEYTPVIFNAYQDVEGERKLIYHTNVLMCMGDTFAVICLDSIDDKQERKNVVKHLKQDGKEIVEISDKQMHQFAGNMLQVESGFGKKFIVMSDRALKSLDEKQIDTLEKHGEILSSSLEIIENCGGGSARCMMAEVFLPTS
jgi:hypothetical protein